jgi:hypothetical protein
MCILTIIKSESYNILTKTPAFGKVFFYISPLLTASIEVSSLYHLKKEVTLEVKQGAN